ncbi:MAG: ATP-binding cassette domain-containing protein [Planctomycetes bacterium]|nr:ATP-binding cassette domain-containing protein [Planctomycetota bacterium]
MGLIRVQNVTKQFGTQIVLNGVSLELNTGETVGLIGANGSGKSTLFKLIAGELKPDMGTITRSKGLAVGYLAQEPDVSPSNTLHDEVASAFAGLLVLERKLHDLSEQMAEHHHGPKLSSLMKEYDRVRAEFETAGGYAIEQRVNEVLGGLGFTTADYSLPISALSGGQKCRAALAKLLLTERQFLLLDEPTNHLDIDAVRWLEKFLAGYHGGAVIVSHDRYLLDRLADRIVEVERQRLVSYRGNYSTYLKAKAVNELTQQRKFEKDKVFIEKERDFFARFHAAQRVKEAKGRIKRLERRLSAGEFVTEQTAQRKTVSFNFDKTELRAATVADVDGLSKAYGDKVLFRDLMFQVQNGQRFAITGPNGVGKTTLLRILLGTVEADAGRALLDPRFEIGYYAQEVNDLEPGQTVLNELLGVRPDLSETAARSLLGSFLFTGDDVFKTTDNLSGGEQSRVRLLKLIMSSPDVLILDEPTNHLDIASREALEDALRQFPGAIIAVSHDRYFIDRMAERLLVMRPEACKVYNGNYSIYIEQVERERIAADQAAKAQRRKQSASRKQTKSAAKPGQAAPGARFRKLSLDKLEALIIEREEQIVALNARFADQAVYKDPQEVARLREEFDRLKSDLTAAESAWDHRASG